MVPQLAPGTVPLTAATMAVTAAIVEIIVIAAMLVFATESRSSLCLCMALSCMRQQQWLAPPASISDALTVLALLLLLSALLLPEATRTDTELSKRSRARGDYCAF